MSRYESYDINEANGFLSDQNGQFGRIFPLERFDGKRALVFIPAGGEYDIEVGVRGRWGSLATGVVADISIGPGGAEEPITGSDMFQAADSIRFMTVTASASAEASLGGWIT